MPKVGVEVSMNHFILLITSKKKLSLCLLLIFFIIFSAFFITKLDYPHHNNALKVDNAEAKSVLSPENENKQLKGILSSIVPSEDILLYENNSRNISDLYISNVLPAITPKEVLDKGKTLAYIFTYTNEEYLRPIYSDTWKQAYYQGWLYLPRKIISARHTLFVYTGNSSNIFNLDGELGFYRSIALDEQNYINILIYNFDLQKVVQHGNQIAISGMPTKKGVQIISIKINDVAIQKDESEQLTIHLCTPTGLEIDYQNISFPKVPNGQDDFGSVDETFSNINSVAGNINEENAHLKQELTHYISDSTSPIYFQYNGGYQTSNVLNINIDLENAINYASKIDFNILYNNEKYTRPIYHPEWKKHSDRDWCYIPRKMYINMKKLFVFSSDEYLSFDLCAELGFFEEYPKISDDQVGLLVYNFNVSKVSLFENNILLTGTPSRAGIQIVNIAKNTLKRHKDYAVRLVTTDFCEIDIDVIKN